MFGKSPNKSLEESRDPSRGSSKGYDKGIVYHNAAYHSLYHTGDVHHCKPHGRRKQKWVIVMIRRSPGIRPVVFRCAVVYTSWTVIPKLDTFFNPETLKPNP